MKRWMFGFLIVFFLWGSAAAFQVSGEDEELPGISEEYANEL